ncbi:hypothetical protein PMAYCL1PPCAC_24902, partial [Pristionchus mayeri]
EINAVFEDKGNEFSSNAVNVINVMQSELVGVKNIVTGIEDKLVNENEESVVVVHKVIEEKVNDLKSDEHVSEAVGKGYSFLFDVLSKLKKFIVGHEACLVSFDPNRREVAFKSITRQEAEKMGNGVTDEFIARFKVHQEDGMSSMISAVRNFNTASSDLLIRLEVMQKLLSTANPNQLDTLKEEAKKAGVLGHLKTLMENTDEEISMRVKNMLIVLFPEKSFHELFKIKEILKNNPSIEEIREARSILRDLPNEYPVDELVACGLVPFL